MENKSQTIIVIGSGMVGIACALRLQEKGYSVQMVDKLGIGSGTSMRSACLLTASSIVPVSIPSLPRQIPEYLLSPSSPLSIRYSHFPKALPWLVRFLLAGKDSKVQKISEALRVLQKDTLEEHRNLAGNSEAFQYIQESDLVYLYFDKNHYLDDSYSWDIRRDKGVEFYEVEACELREMEPDLSKNYQFAVRVPKHGFLLNSKKYLEALYQQFFHLGGKFQQAEVFHIDAAHNQVQLQTDMGTLESEKLVIAGGVWSAKLALQLGDKIPLESEGGYYVDISNHGIKINHPFINIKYKIAATPISGSIRFGGLVELGGVDCSSNFKRCQMLIENAKNMFPAIQTESFTRGHGQRPSIADSLPVIGPSSRFSNVYYAFGHQHVGISTGPVTGRWLAELVATNHPPVDLSPFSVKRFSGKPQ